MLTALDKFLDRFTMYRLLIYYLIGLLLVAVGLSAAGKLSYSPVDLTGFALFAVAVAWVINKIIAWYLDITVNSDSTIITALILALIISPTPDTFNVAFIAAATGLAVGSKYLLTFRKRHIFNPAAIAVVLMAFGPKQTASWWVGTTYMMPFVVIGGFLLVRRLRRGAMVTSFLVTGLAATAFDAFLNHNSPVTALHNTIFDSALLFLAFVMLTEPLTSPTTKKKQIWYGILTGLLFPPQFHIGNLYSTPERALIVGNIYAFIVNPKVKLFPKLDKMVKITPDSADFIFTPDRKFKYEPGQYMEFTLRHDNVDSRGQRRYFTLASSPTEASVRIGVKFYKRSSSFKEAMLDMNTSSPISANSLGGDFTLPKDTNQKITFIAGGIGVTPYRSMIKYLVDTKEKRDITLLYSANTAQDIAYTDVFEDARHQLGINAVYMLTKPDTIVPDHRFRAGFITPEVIKKEVPDFHERLFYISGPQPMVAGIAQTLHRLGVSHDHIKTDFFSGYA
jgi:ferredoxin-NADP reductase/Na+-translocating ferredoxin:NAD+ oxidoreductase RnfD subunit